MPKKFWSSERIVGLSAMLISLLTLLVFLYQTNLIRKQQYLSVYPHLVIGNGGTGTLDYQFVLSNEGIGPAIIESIEITGPDGQKYPELHDYLVEQLEESDSIWLYGTDLYVGQLIPAGEKISLYGLWDEEQTQSQGLPPNTLEGAYKLRRVLNAEKLMIKVTYRSIYEERWFITNHTLAPVKE